MPQSPASDQSDVSADYASSLWNTGGSWLIGSHWRPRTKKALIQQSQSFERQPGAQARLMNNLHFLGKTSLSTLGEVALLSSM